MKVVDRYDYDAMLRTVSAGEWLYVDIRPVEIRYGGKWVHTLGHYTVPGSFLYQLFSYLKSIDYGYRLVSDDNAVVEPPFGIVGSVPFDNKDFKRRCIEGEMIVAPYTKYRCFITPNFSSVLSTKVVSTTRDWTSYPDKFYIGIPLKFNLVESYWMDPRRDGFSTRWATSFFGGLKSTGGGGPALVKNRITSAPTTMQAALGISPQQLYSRIRSHADNLPVDGELVQNALAHANMGELDLLTALAETPETIRSLVDGALLLKKMLVDFKAKEFSISKSYERKARKLMKMDRSKKRFISKKRFVASGGNPKDYHRERQSFVNNIDSKISDEHRNLYLRSSASEAVEATAQVWLNYRYNIMPVVYTIEDSLQALKKFASVYRSFRRTESETFFDFSDIGEFTGQNIVTKRAFIKREYGTHELKHLDAVISGDILVTALERVPLWGIITDWFVSLTSFLKAITWSPKYKKSVSTYSKRIEVDGRITTETGSAVIKFDYYQRVVIPDPHAYLDLYFKFDLTTAQKLDSLSFLFLSNKKSLKSYMAN